MYENVLYVQEKADELRRERTRRRALTLGVPPRRTWRAAIGRRLRLAGEWLERPAAHRAVAERR